MAPLNKRGGNGYALSRNLNPQLVPIASCSPLGRGTRKHPPGQIRKLAASIERFGFVLPTLINSERKVVAGWGLVLAAKQLGLKEVPAVMITDLSEAEPRLVRLALNRMTEDATWDREELALEFSEILQVDPDVELQASGFEIDEIETVLDLGGHAEPNVDGEDKHYPMSEVGAGAPPLTRSGDLWLVGKHRIFCGDPLENASFSRVLGDDRADMVFTDLPNTIVSYSPGVGAAGPIDLNVRAANSLGGQLECFLRIWLGHASCWSREGAIHFVCTQWPDLPDVLGAGKAIYASFEGLCVWTRRDQNPAASGLLYRPQHQLILVFRVGRGSPIKNMERGGKIRTDVWDYPTPKASQTKPVAMIADAIKDWTTRGGVILDPFGGCGMTLIAAEQTARCARLIELDPSLVDLSIERWQRLTGGTAHHIESGRALVRNHDAG
jgi:DNA methylase/ParB-like nuclease domain